MRTRAASVALLACAVLTRPAPSGALEFYPPGHAAPSMGAPFYGLPQLPVRSDAPFPTVLVVAATRHNERSLTEVEPVLRGARPRFELCYRYALAADPTAAGGIVLRAIVAASGQSLAVAVSRSTVPVAALGNCVARVLYTLRFQPRARERFTEHLEVLDVGLTFLRG